MKPPAFEYVRPATLDEAVTLLADSSRENKVLAGGQSLIPLLNFRLAFPQRLVDIKGIASLSSLRREGNALVIGATTPTREVELSSTVKQALPILSEATRWVGHVQIRNRGTVGGSIAHADPSAEIPALCVLLGAEFLVRSPRGSRTAAAEDFFHGFLSTDLQPDEVLEAVRFPIPVAGSRWGFREFALRRGDFALAGAGCVLEVSGGAVTDARAVVFGASDVPIRASDAESALQGQRLTKETIAQAAARAGTRLQATAAGDADRAYRAEVAEVMLRRALEDALDHGETPAGAA